MIAFSVSKAWKSGCHLPVLKETAVRTSAGCIACTKVARGKVATVAIEYISFLSPIQVGAVVGCYTKIRGVGRSSVRVAVEAWVNDVSTEGEWTKVAEGEFIFVAIDDNGRTRAIPG